MVMKIDLKESFLRAFVKKKYDKNQPTKSGKKEKGLFLPPLSRYPPYSGYMIALLHQMKGRKEMILRTYRMPAKKRAQRKKLKS